MKTAEIPNTQQESASQFPDQPRPLQQAASAATRRDDNNIPPEIANRIDELSTLIQLAQRNGNNRLASAVRLIGEIKRRDHSIITDKTKHQIIVLLDTCIRDVKSWLDRAGVNI